MIGGGKEKERRIVHWKVATQGSIRCSITSQEAQNNHSKSIALILWYKGPDELIFLFSTLQTKGRALNKMNIF